MKEIKQHIQQTFAFLREQVAGMFVTCLLCFVGMTVLFHFMNMNNPEFVATMLTTLTESFESKGVYGENSSIAVLPLLLNNIMVSAAAVAWGAVPLVFLSIPVLAVNAIAISVMSAHFVLNGQGLAVMLAGLLPHGIVEIPALLLAVALGMNMSLQGTIRIFKRDMVMSFSELLLQTIHAYAWTVLPMLVLAAFLEIGVTPQVLRLFM